MIGFWVTMAATAIFAVPDDVAVACGMGLLCASAASMATNWAAMHAMDVAQKTILARLKADVSETPQMNKGIFIHEELSGSKKSWCSK